MRDQLSFTRCGTRLNKSDRRLMDVVMQKPLGKVVVLALLVGCLVIGSRASAQNRDQAPQKLTLGVVAASNQKEIEAHFRAFANYLARKISGPAAAGAVIVAPTATDLIKLLQEKKVDFYLESAYPTYVINSVNDAGTLLARRWKGGMAEYQSLVFTSRSSGINRVQDLRGKLVAFEDPESSSGYLLPKMFLQRQGLKLTDKTGGGPAGSEETGYIFGQTDTNVVQLVLS